MRTVRRLLYRDIAFSVVFVAVAFLALFFFIDFVDELEDVGKQGYTVTMALTSGLLKVPGWFYELFPIAVLIGTIFSLSRMAQSSEYTILRTGGLGPGRALALLSALGLVFAVFTFVVGDYVAPVSERQAVVVKARSKGPLRFGSTGAWLRDRQALADGEHNFSVNVAQASADGSLQGIRIYEFDPLGRLITRVQAANGRVGHEGTWHMDKVQLTHWPLAAGDTAQVHQEQEAQWAWPSNLNAGVVAAALLPVGTMSTVELWRYTSHLNEHEQAAQRYAIRFWKKALYPFACLVMVALALPFAYMQARGGGISFKVFGGILLGISFVLLNNVAGHLGMLNGWNPFLVAAVPSLLYLLMSLAAFTWLVRYR
jgi:lipopolysaccharide export system permease protein